MDLLKSILVTVYDAMVYVVPILTKKSWATFRSVVSWLRPRLPMWQTARPFVLVIGITIGLWCFVVGSVYFLNTLAEAFI